MIPLRIFHLDAISMFTKPHTPQKSTDAYKDVHDEWIILDSREECEALLERINKARDKADLPPAFLIMPRQLSDGRWVQNVEYNTYWMTEEERERLVDSRVVVELLKK